jgi:phosphopantothenoylcysteine synthetase/decarboxylase
MKVLITSGGTKVPIDPVRNISNMSKGTFGSKIATACLDQGHEVHYLISKGGETPFLLRCDFANMADHIIAREIIEEKIKWSQFVLPLYKEYQYQDYDDYRQQLEKLVQQISPDVVVLSAAVSDYVVEPSPNKIRSTDELTIQLKPAEKIISKIKSWCPTCKLIGFKLLVGESEEKLIEAARESIRKNGCDSVIANDLNSLKSGNHEVIAVFPDHIIKYQSDQKTCAITDQLQNLEKERNYA